MNAYSAVAGPYNGNQASRLSPPVPTGHGKAILESYSKDMVSGFAKDGLYNPVCQSCIGRLQH